MAPYLYETGPNQYTYKNVGDPGTIVHAKHLVPNLKPAVGAWGWAAQAKREELMIATAALLGCDFAENPIFIQILEGELYPHPDFELAPRWYVAWRFLQARGIEVTAELRVVRIAP